MDFSTDKKKICNFIKTVSSTCGYDSDECYELVLRQVGGIFAWGLLWVGGRGGGIYTRTLMMINLCLPCYLGVDGRKSCNKRPEHLLQELVCLNVCNFGRMFIG